MHRCLNLDGMFVPVPLAEIEFTVMKFGGGELHIKLNTNIDYSKVEKVVITNRFNSSDDLMEVLLAVDALRRVGVKSFDLVMPYVPYDYQPSNIEIVKKPIKVAKPLPNPNPDRYEILDYTERNGNLLIVIKYLDCTNYEGKKILYYEDCSYNDLMRQKSIDPHFSDNDMFKSPTARFEPTHRGYQLAKSILNR